MPFENRHAEHHGDVCNVIVIGIAKDGYFVVDQTPNAEVSAG